jgi:N-acetylglucosaminyl-diphospho-decaprenol L-rhamnosyltransferase
VGHDLKTPVLGFQHRPVPTQSCVKVDPRLDIIIVNWNSGSQLNECLRHIEKADKRGFALDRVVVVDNGSTDFSATRFSNRPKELVLLKNEENRGFAGACNQGATDSRAEYLLFMNPDVYLSKDVLCATIEFFENPENWRIAICGPRLVGIDGNTQKSCSRFPTAIFFLGKALGLERVRLTFFRSSLMTEWDHDEDRYVEQPIGACLFVRRSVFQELKGFDEQFFMYFEEVDLCLRCKQAGHEIYFLSRTSAMHSGGGCSSQVPAERLFYLLRSRILFGFKHFSFGGTMTLLLATLLIEPLSRCGWALARISNEELRATLKAYLLLLRSTQLVLRTLRESQRTSAPLGMQVHSARTSTMRRP